MYNFSFFEKVVVVESAVCTKALECLCAVAGVIFFIFTIVLVNWKIILYTIAGLVILALLTVLLGPKIVMWTIVGVALVAAFLISVITGLFWGQ